MQENLLVNNNANAYSSEYYPSENGDNTEYTLSELSLCPNLSKSNCLYPNNELNQSENNFQ